jgi:hypothetical protein
VTITYVGAGTSSTAVNAQVTPVVNPGTVAGDLVLVFASVRNSGGGTVNDKSGWTRIEGGANIAAFGRIWQSGDTAIGNFTFAGSVANADTIAQTITLRGVEPRLPDLVAVTNSRTNGSAQDIATTSLDVPGNAHAVITFVWKQDDATAYSTPAGFTAGPFTSVTAGDDASQAVYLQIQTTESDLSTGTITITGGAAAISRAVAFALRPAASLVVTEQNVYPPRAAIAVSGMTIGDQLDVYRVVAGARTLVRGGHVDSVDDTGYFVVDAEMPFGTPVRYVAVINGSVEYSSDNVTYELPRDHPVLTDAITGLSAEVVIMAADDKVYARDSARFRVGGRNLMVGAPFAQAEGRYELYFETTVGRENLMTLLASATQGIVQLRQALTGTYEDVDAYLSVDSVAVGRYSQDGSDPRRLVTIDYAEVQPWSDELLATGWTYGEVETFYSGISYSSAAGDFATYLDAVQGDFS